MQIHQSFIYPRKKKKMEQRLLVILFIVRIINQDLQSKTKWLMLDLTYDKGLDRYYGLLDLALKYGIFKQTSTRIELPDGTTQFGKTINNNPEKYFTEEEV